jgi:hypothetical protein
MLAFFLNPKPINGLPIKSVNSLIHRLNVSPRVTDQLQGTKEDIVPMKNTNKAPKKG